MPSSVSESSSLPTDWSGTRDAVMDFFEAHQLEEKIHVVWHDAARDTTEPTRGVWWTKRDAGRHSEPCGAATYAHGAISFRATVC